jgi:glycosyltransferase involved in cell wall biosynthesis
MRILMLHNFYRQPGGEDTCFFAECEMLRGHNDEVSTIELLNDSTAGMSDAALAINTVWNRRSYAAVAQRIREFQPNVVHCHNTFPLLSPAVYYAADRAGIPVVQTLHNYRLLCLKGILFREGNICEACLGRAIPWRGVTRRCYHGSLAQSASVASLLIVHRALGTWRRKVDLFLAVSAFARDRYIAGGFDPESIIVKPNTLSVEPVEGDGGEGYALVVGRLSEEKGLGTVLAAWQKTPGNPRLLIVGDGPLRTLEGEYPASDSVQFLGQRSRKEVYDLMGKAAFLIAASEWYETFGMTIIEAFACGTPVIAARVGAYTELVEDGVTGFLFQPGDVDGLQDAVSRILQMSTLQVMRRAARRRFEDSFAQAHNYEMLMTAYSSARQRRLERPA